MSQTSQQFGESKMSNYLSAYDVTPGTVVSVHLKDKILRGECSIQLVSEISKNPGEDRLILERPLELPSGKQHSGSVSFPVNEIRQIEVIEYGLFKKRGTQADEGPPPSLPPGHPTAGGKKKKDVYKKSKTGTDAKDLAPIEIQLRTYVIRDPTQFKVLTKLLKEVDVCGISFEGQNVGRNGIVSWMIMTAGKTLIPFDVDALYEQVPELWKSLERSVFSNEKLIKIIHDGRPAADYLWHVHGITMVNVFDTQVADALIAKEHLGYAPPSLSPLSDCLERYNRRIPLEELDFLRKFEDEVDFSLNSFFLQKPLPPPEYLKLCAIKVKHLVPLRENMMIRLMDRFNKCVDAHLSSFKNRNIQDYSTLSKKPREIPNDLMNLLEDHLSKLIV